MQREYDIRVVDYCQTPENYLYPNFIRDKLIDDHGVIEERNALLLHSGAFIRYHSNRMIKKIVIAIDCFRDDKV